MNYRWDFIIQFCELFGQGNHMKLLIRPSQDFLIQFGVQKAIKEDVQLGIFSSLQLKEAHGLAHDDDGTRIAFKAFVRLIDPVSKTAIKK